MSKDKYRSSGAAPPAPTGPAKGMFDDSVMDQSNMDMSDMSMDIGNLSTIFGGGAKQIM